MTLSGPLAVLVVLFSVLMPFLVVFLLLPMASRSTLASSATLVRGALVDARIDGTLPDVPEVSRLLEVAEALAERPRLASHAAVFATWLTLRRYSGREPYLVPPSSLSGLSQYWDGLCTATARHLLLGLPLGFLFAPLLRVPSVRARLLSLAETHLSHADLYSPLPDSLA